MSFFLFHTPKIKYIYSSLVHEKIYEVLGKLLKVVRKLVIIGIDDKKWCHMYSLLTSVESDFVLSTRILLINRTYLHNVVFELFCDLTFVEMMDMNEQQVCTKLCFKFSKQVAELIKCWNKQLPTTPWFRCNSYGWFDRLKNGRTSLDNTAKC